MTPELRIGEVDGPDALADVSDVLVGPGGTIYIGEDQAAQIRVYDAQGKLRRRIGGQGAGPGEFLSIGDLAWRADTLIVEDRYQQRFSAFRNGREFLRTFRLLPVGAYINKSPLLDGGILARPRDSDYSEPGAPPMPLMRVLPGLKAEVDTLAFILASGGGRCLEFDRGLRTCFRRPVMSEEQVALDPHGRHFTVVTGVFTDAPERRHFWVRRMTPAGDTTMISRIAYTPRPIAQSARDSIRTGFRQKYERSNERMPPRFKMTAEEIDRVVEEGLDLPPFYPPVTEAVSTADGGVWLRRSDTGAKRVAWLVLDRNGAHRATVVGVPAELEIHFISDDAVYGVVRDDLDVEYVVRYGIDREQGVASKHPPARTPQANPPIPVTFGPGTSSRRRACPRSFAPGR